MSCKHMQCRCWWKGKILLCFPPCYMMQRWSKRERVIDGQKRKKTLRFPPITNWDLACNFACFCRCRFRYFTKVQENLVLLQKLLLGNVDGVIREKSLMMWRWNISFNSQLHDWSQADLAMRKCESGVWVWDGTLKLGCSRVIWDISVHKTDMYFLLSIFLHYHWINDATKFQFHRS